MGAYAPEMPPMEDHPSAAPAPSQAAPQAPVQAPPQQQQAPDPLDLVKQDIFRRYQQASLPPANGGMVKRLLSNFIGSMSHGMMQPTQNPDFLRQQALTDLNTVSTTQANLSLHQMMANQYATQPVQLPDGSTINVMNKDAAGLQGKLASAMATQTAAQTKTINVPGVGAFAWDDTQNKYVPVEGGQVPQHMLQPGEAEFLGFPKGTTQVPQATYSQAVGAKVRPLTTVQGANDQYQINRLTGDKTALGVGNPRMLTVQARQYPAIDTEHDNALIFANPFQIMNSKGKIVPAGQGSTALNKEALKEDIRGNIQATRTALQNMDTEFTPSFRAQLALALRSNDPRSAVSTLMGSMGAGAMTDKQQDVVIALTNLTENAMAMRSMLGAGQGSDELRSAIKAVIPSGSSPTKEYALKQLVPFENTLNRLGRGIPNVPLRNVQHTAGGSAQGLTEGATGTGSDGRKYIVKGGVWVPR